MPQVPRPVPPCIDPGASTDRHYGHARFEVCVDRIRHSFDDAVLVVDGVDLGNSVVFKGKGRAFDDRGPGVVGRPKNLDRAAAEPLLAGFAQVMSALEEWRRQHLAIRTA